MRNKETKRNRDKREKNTLLSLLMHSERDIRYFPGLFDRDSSLSLLGSVSPRSSGSPVTPGSVKATMSGEETGSTGVSERRVREDSERPKPEKVTVR